MNKPIAQLKRSSGTGYKVQSKSYPDKSGQVTVCRLQVAGYRFKCDMSDNTTINCFPKPKPCQMINLKLKTMKIFQLLSAFVLLALISCTQFPGKKNLSGNDLKVTQDTFFTEMFNRDCCGYTGGDGTISILLPDGRIVWLFGDTFLGTVNPDHTRPKMTPIFIRNSVVIQDGDSVITLHQGSLEKPASFALPPPEMTGGQRVSEDSVWFWPNNGFVEDNKLKLFLSGIMQADTGMWGFRWMGTWLASYSLPDITEEEIAPLSYSFENEIHYGIAILQEKGYTYVYGKKDDKPHVARFKSGDVTGPWEFYTGDDWSSNPTESGPMSDIDVSEQFSVIKSKNKYVLISQTGAFLSPDIYSFTSDKPYTGWDQKTLLYTTPIPETNKNLFTYNAMAHPQFIKDGMLLISYNTNSFVLEDHFRDADIYRPRFIRVPMKLIIP